MPKPANTQRTNGGSVTVGLPQGGWQPIETAPEDGTSVPEPPGEIWLTVEAGSAVPTKYLSPFVTAKFPYGLNGPAEAVTRFNLTAYVQDMIKKALSSDTHSPPREGGQ